jgi:acetolactate synthase-1/2/3 large subunit
MSQTAETPALSPAPQDQVKYADLVVEWLQELGYTHCFFVAGGNNMHLLNAVRGRLEWVPFVHEVSAGIAAEYFNASQGEGRAFVLVTAGPGITQAMTALAGAYLESRELLVLGGQVKSTDLAGGSGIRQRGIQEIDGVAIASPVCVRAERLARPVGRGEFLALAQAGAAGRRGPVFVELCLDVQGAPVSRAELEDDGPPPAPAALPEPPEADVQELLEALRGAERPVLLLGAGVRRETVDDLLPALRRLGAPLQTVWTAMDRLGPEEPLYAGRPDSWGQRSANLLLQQADLIVALGTRLGLQRTGFNWQAFGPVATVAQVELDRAELEKGHPRVDIPVLGDRWLATGFDPAAARALGLRSPLPDLVLLALVALAGVAVVAAVGALLATALLVVPAATTRLVCHRLGPWQLATAALAGAQGVAGLWLSVQLDVPPGPAVAVTAGAVFALVALARAPRLRTAPA